MSGSVMAARSLRRELWRYAIILSCLVLAAVVGPRSSARILALLLAAIGIAAVLQDLRWALLALPALSAFVPVEFGTGTAVSLNATVLAIPGIAALWLVRETLRGGFHWRSSRLTRPTVALLLVSVVSLLRGAVTWDLAVPRPPNMTVVQIGQVSIYLLSFVILWLTPNLIGDLKWLRRLAYTFLGVIAAALVVLLALRPRGVVLPHLSGIWMVALALGLAACDSGLSARQRGLLLVVGLAGPIGLRLFHQGWMANWVPPIVAAAAVLWFYSPRVRWPLVVSLVLLLGLVGTAGLLRAVNWDYEWETSGGSRLALWRSVIELASGSPWLGLGPGAYRHYHYTKPLAYGGALWMRPTVSAHNLFVDLFAQVGLLGLACYVWLLVEIFLMAWRLYTRRDGFARGYALGALGALAGLLVADMLAASSLPFVYNVGFKGFRGSALSWMLFGGLVVLETLSGPETRES